MVDAVNRNGLPADTSSPIAFRGCSPLAVAVAAGYRTAAFETASAFTHLHHGRSPELARRLVVQRHFTFFISRKSFSDNTLRRNKMILPERRRFATIF
jgi:hypothetical protein